MIRFGGTEAKSFERYGARFSLGYWFDDAQQCGLEVNYFFLASRSIGYAESSDGYPVLAQPFFNTQIQQQDSALTTYPGIASGSIQVKSRSFLNGAEANFWYTLNQCPDYPVRVLVGFRYAGFDENLSVDSESEILPTAPVPFAGNHISVIDHFDCNNSFFGPQLGLMAAYRLRRLEIEGVAKVGLGDSYDVLRIAGSTSINTQPAENFNAGLLALATNSGTHTRNVFAVLPEADINVRYKITEHMRATIGFSLLYWSSLLRAGDQVDLRINPAHVPTSNNFGAGTGPALPAVLLRGTDFLAYGLNIGLEFDF
jgi:hypothetical protein